MRLKNYYCSGNVKTFKIWESRGKMMFFLKNTLKIFRRTKLAKHFLDCVSDCPIAEECLKRSKIDFFGKIAGIVFGKKIQHFSKIAFFGKVYLECVPNGIIVERISKARFFGFSAKT